jgi:hypothetical protein
MLVDLSEPHQPAGSARELLLMALAAVAFRIILCLLATTTTDTGFSDYAEAGDGIQFIAYARAWLGNTAELDANPVFRRLFPGYPALIALLHHCGVPISVAALVPSWLACGAVPVFCALYFHDRRIGWGTAAFTPSYVLSGSLISTEAMCLLFSLIGLLQLRRGRTVLAGLAFGLGGLFRPVAVFAMIGGLGPEVVAGRWRKVITVTAATGTAVAAGLLSLQWRFGDALMTVHWNSRAYGGQILTWPFKSLIMTPTTTPTASWKVIFVAVHLLVVSVGCILSIKWLRSTPETNRWLAQVAALWLCCNTLYVLCIGDVWGFHDFPRFLVPALPPLLWVCRRFLPVRPSIWIAAGILSVTLALIPARWRLLHPSPIKPVADVSRYSGKSQPIHGYRIRGEAQTRSSFR